MSNEINEEVPTSEVVHEAPPPVVAPSAEEYVTIPKSLYETLLAKLTSPTPVQQSSPQGATAVEVATAVVNAVSDKNKGFDSSGAYKLKILRKVDLGKNRVTLQYEDTMWYKPNEWFYYNGKKDTDLLSFQTLWKRQFFPLEDQAPINWFEILNLESDPPQPGEMPHPCTMAMGRSPSGSVPSKEPKASFDDPSGYSQNLTAKQFEAVVQGNPVPRNDMRVPREQYNPATEETLKGNTQQTMRHVRNIPGAPADEAKAMQANQAKK